MEEEERVSTPLPRDEDVGSLAFELEGFLYEMMLDGLLLDKPGGVRCVVPLLVR